MISSRGNAVARLVGVVGMAVVLGACGSAHHPKGGPAGPPRTASVAPSSSTVPHAGQTPTNPNPAPASAQPPAAPATTALPPPPVLPPNAQPTAVASGFVDAYFNQNVCNEDANTFTQRLSAFATPDVVQQVTSTGCGGTSTSARVTVTGTQQTGPTSVNVNATVTSSAGPTSGTVACTMDNSTGKWLVAAFQVSGFGG